jgi:ribulose-5-phosphate 4-epimerase/fuculose-1-phosphate aldolase
MACITEGALYLSMWHALSESWLVLLKEHYISVCDMPWVKHVLYYWTSTISQYVTCLEWIMACITEWALYLSMWHALSEAWLVLLNEHYISVCDMPWVNHGLYYWTSTISQYVTCLEWIMACITEGALYLSMWHALSESWLVLPNEHYISVCDMPWVNHGLYYWTSTISQYVTCLEWIMACITERALYLSMWHVLSEAWLVLLKEHYISVCDMPWVNHGLYYWTSTISQYVTCIEWIMACITERALYLSMWHALSESWLVLLKEHYISGYDMPWVLGLLI